MTDSTRHRIKKAIFNVKFPDERTAFSGRKRLIDFFCNSLLPVLKNAFDTYAQGNKIYHINRIELDLGHLDIERLDEKLITQEILEQLNHQWQELSPEAVTVVPTSVSLEETFTGFLQTGLLPWQSVFNTIEEMEAALWSLTPTQAYQIVRNAVPLLQQRSLRLRLVYQFSTRFFEWLIQQLHPETAEQLLQLGRMIMGGLELPDAKEYLLAVAIAMPRNSPISSITLTNQLRDYLPPALSESLSLPDTESSAVSNSSSALSTSDTTSIPTLSTPPEEELLPQNLRELLPESSSPTPTLEDEEDGWYIRNAGIVLLHPFLTRFFDRLMLLNSQRQFVAVESQMKAVHLLHYITTGEEQPQEHETLLYKVLCGFPVEQPLVRELSLTQQDRAESADLLSAAIQHWDKLKNTSADGLREAFLQRDGKLIKRETGWKLIVEQRSLDILLNYLPWGLSMVRFPWMESLLSVDWA